jgi:hypothetical protein
MRIGDGKRSGGDSERVSGVRERGGGSSERSAGIDDLAMSSRVEQQHYGLRGDTLGAAEEAEALGGRRFDVHVIGGDFEKLGDLAANLVPVGADSWCFSKHSDVGISYT